MIETLKDAISLLKGHNSDPTRATEWAAKGLLAKVYMQARRPLRQSPYSKILSIIVGRNWFLFRLFEYVLCR